MDEGLREFYDRLLEKRKRRQSSSGNKQPKTNKNNPITVNTWLKIIGLTITASGVISTILINC